MKYPCQHGVTNFCRVCEEVERHLNRPHPEQNTQRPNVFEYDGAFRCMKCGMIWGAITNPQPCICPPSPQTEAGDVESDKVVAGLIGVAELEKADRMHRQWDSSSVRLTPSRHEELLAAEARVKELEAKLAGALKVTTESTIDFMKDK